MAGPWDFDPAGLGELGLEDVGGALEVLVFFANQNQGGDVDLGEVVDQVRDGPRDVAQEVFVRVYGAIRLASSLSSKLTSATLAMRSWTGSSGASRFRYARSSSFRARLCAMPKIQVENLARGS